MNVFEILGVHYEQFHTRMLGWLLSPGGEHQLGDAILRVLFDELGLDVSGTCQIEGQVKINVPHKQRWRIADLLIRSPGQLILLEAKVDPGYQDVEQVRDEIAAGLQIATDEQRQFVFVLMAPGPLSNELTTALEIQNGRFVQWNTVIERFDAVSREGAPAFTAEIIRQYFEFALLNRYWQPMGRAGTPQTGRAGNPLGDSHVLREAEQAISEIIRAIPASQALTAQDVWPEFIQRFPDHAAALDERYKNSSNYSAKAWFAFKLQKYAAAKNLLEDTGEWRASSPEWGFPRLRLYRRMK